MRIELVVVLVLTLALALALAICTAWKPKLGFNSRNVIHSKDLILGNPAGMIVKTKVQIKPAVSNCKSVVMIMPGNENILNHSNLWDLFSRKLGRRKACKYIPESYVIHDTASSDFAELLDSHPVHDASQFILKGEESGITPLYLARQGLEDVLDTIKCNKLVARTFAPTACTQAQLDLQKYTLAQKLIPNPMILGRRVFRIRCFLLLTQKSMVTSGYLHENGLVHWARDRYNPDHQTVNTVLASRTNMSRGRSAETIKQMYNGYPLTIKELSEYLTQQGLGQAVESNITNALQALCHVMQSELSSGLYAVDIALNKMGEAFLLKVKRCQQDATEDDSEVDILTRIRKDALAVQQVIAVPGNTAFRKIWPQPSWQA